MIVLENCRVPRALLTETDLTHFPCLDHELNPVSDVRILVDQGKVRDILPVSQPFQPGSEDTVEDMKQSFLTCRFLDSHVHLDKAHSWNRAPNRSGTFAEAIRVLGQDKENWTEEDLYSRANYALKCAWHYGTTAVRTHIDTGLPWAEVSYSVMAQLRKEWAAKIELQTVSLCGIDQYDSYMGAELADLPVKYGASALGGMPLMNPDLDRQLNAFLKLAAEREMGIDLHVDESSDPSANTLLSVANAVLRNKFPYPVNCGHCCSLAVQTSEIQVETLVRVKEAGISIISLPLCNLYLQDRYTTEARKTSSNMTPFWRGITLIQEWIKQDTVLACASDNVRDAFYAYGDLDAFEVLLYSIRMAHLDNDLYRAISVVTTAPAQIMSLPEHGKIAPGIPARFISWDCRSFSEFLSRPSLKRRLFEGDQWIYPEHPDPKNLPI